MFNRFDPTPQTALRQVSSPLATSLQTWPGPEQPGTLGDQFLLIHAFFLTDPRRRRVDRDGVWQSCRALVLSWRF